MKERPILFSGDMVRAILEGRKTQTRRVIKPQFGQLWGYGVKSDTGVFSAHVDIDDGTGVWKWLPCPYGQPGDRLWVRESFYKRTTEGTGKPIWYKADSFTSNVPWKPSIHMPRKYSRITLEITDVRVERVQEISEEDAEAEGAGLFVSESRKGNPDQYRTTFKDRWNSLNAKRGFGWDANPWVWVITLKRTPQKNLNESGKE